MKKYSLTIFLIFQILFIQILKSYPQFVETFYSNLLYQKISFFSRTIFGIVNFSIGDCLYLIFILVFLYNVFKILKTWKFDRMKFVFTLFNFISIFYFFFHFLWGLNYYRIPLSEKMRIDTRYTDAELITMLKVSSDALDIIYKKHKTYCINFMKAMYDDYDEITDGWNTVYFGSLQEFYEE